MEWRERGGKLVIEKKGEGGGKSKRGLLIVLVLFKG